MRRFEFSDSTSNKFWEVVVKGKTLNVTFGKIGTNGQSKPKAFATPAKAKAEMEKLIREKTNKGYKEIISPTVRTKNSETIATKTLPEEEIPAFAKNPLTKARVQAMAAKLRIRKKSFYGADLSDFDAMTLEAAQELAPFCFDLDLSGLKRISAPVIEALNSFAFEGSESKWHTCELDLSGLSVVDSELASAFVDRFNHLPKWAEPGSIVFNGKALKELSPSVANVLSRCKAKILVSPNSLSHLSTEVAKVLCSTNYKNALGLDLYWVESASDEALEIISRYRGDVFLESLKIISHKGAESLSKHKGKLCLSGIKNISNESLIHLSRHKSKLSIGVKKLSDSAAKAFGNHRGGLWFVGLEQLSDIAAEHLAKIRGDLYLDELIDITDRAAQYLSLHKNTLSLKGLLNLTVDAAASLGKHCGELWLSDKCIQSLSNEAIIKISVHPNLVTRYLSSKSIQRIRLGKNNLRKKGNLPLYPEIKRLKKLGATTIRVWFQGMGDDGIFSSTIYKGNKVLEEPHTLDEFGGEIQILYETNQLEIPDGGQDGDAAIMTIDLKTGECIFFKEYNARKEELLDNLLWEGVDELDANLEAEAGEEIEEEIADEISNLNLRKIVLINPIKGKPKLTIKEKIKVEELLKWWLSCEKNTNCICGSDLYSDLSNLGSSKINFHISTSKRKMIFSSGKKKLEFKIQALEKQKIKLEI